MQVNRFLNLVLFFLFGYACGSLPFALWIPIWLNKGDPRRVGSGNIGATNVYRLAGTKVAAFVFVCDCLKGFLPVLFVTHGPDAVYVATGCVLGHVFPWMLRFKGGKGLATSFGVMLVLMPVNTLVSLLCWLVILKITRCVSVAALAASVAQFLGTCFFLRYPDVIFSGFLMILLFYTHRHNILRLVRGNEHVFGK